MAELLAFHLDHSGTEALLKAEGAAASEIFSLGDTPIITLQP